MNNKLNAISTFIRVAEAGSFSAAARQAGQKQSAISQQIAALEAELGVVLLRRTTRSMALTEAGTQYLQQILPLMEAMDEIETQLRPAQQQLQGNLHMQLPSGIGQLFLPYLLNFQREHQGIRLDIALDDRLSDVIGEGVDVALRLAEQPPTTMAARSLARVETVLVAAPALIRATPVNEVTQLAQLPHVRFRGIAKDAPLTLLSSAGICSLAVNTVFRANTSQALMQAIEAGIGIGGLQRPLSAAALDSGRLVHILPDYRLPDRYLYAVFPDARFIPQRVRALVEFLNISLQTMPGFAKS
ncbi:LysR family transcriptional regulator [Pantoea cypripedii]|uniref:LysR family transcriptional regulator n=1 Tax=Pantoea cypripedii TaxID=55209 RepID=UPI002FC6A8E8